MIDVLLDARIVERGHTGIARYVREIASRLGRSGEIRLSAILTDKEPSLEGAGEIVRARAPFLSPAEQVELPARVAAWRGIKRRNALFWVPAYNAACLAPGPLALTVHDANHLALPEQYSRLHTLYYRTVVRLACERARVVVAPSLFARREIVERIGVDEAKVRVVLNAANLPAQPALGDVARVRDARQLPERYVCYVGNFKPHKNLGTLLRAAPFFAGQAALVLVGGREEELGQALPAARSAGAQVLVLPQVSDEELWALVAGAQAFAFPSLYEGFGLPPLEAMALGTPVVSSNAASLPEVVGDAALLVDPLDHRAMGQALRRLLEDAALRETLVRKGRTRAQARTWDDVARETARVLVEAAGEQAQAVGAVSARR